MLDSWWSIYEAISRITAGDCGSGGRDSILLSEGRGFDSPGLHVKVSLGLGQDTEPQTAPDVLVDALHGSQHHHSVNVCMI